MDTYVFHYSDYANSNTILVRADSKEEAVGKMHTQCDYVPNTLSCLGTTEEIFEKIGKDAVHLSSDEF